MCNCGEDLALKCSLNDNNSSSHLLSAYCMSGTKLNVLYSLSLIFPITLQSRCKWKIRKYVS